MARWRLIASTLVVCAIVGSSHALSADLTVQVKGIGAGGGKIVLDLWRNGNHAQYFPDFGKVPASKTNGKTGAGICDWAPGKTSLCRQSTAAAGTAISYTFKGLPTGSYAVSVFHDTDASWDANPTPPFGIPKEGYGVSVESGEPPTIPDFDSAKIAVSGNRTIAIKLIYRP